MEILVQIAVINQELPVQKLLWIQNCGVTFSLIEMFVNLNYSSLDNTKECETEEISYNRPKRLCQLLPHMKTQFCCFFDF